MIGTPLATWTGKVGTIKRDWGTERLELEIQLRRRDNVAPYQDIDHQPCRHYVELSIVGVVYENGRDSGGGQVVEMLREVATEGRLEPRFNTAELLEVAELWKRWHLNGMKAACAHMPEDARQRWDQGEQVECSAGSGYRYGQAWLVEYLPDYVTDTLTAVFGFEAPKVNRHGVEVE